MQERIQGDRGARVRAALPFGNGRGASHFKAPLSHENTHHGMEDALRHRPRRLQIVGPHSSCVVLLDNAAAVGTFVRQGRLAVDLPATVPEWQGDMDPRAAITLDALLHMTSGLRFCEDYVDDQVSDAIKMLFRPGADDMGAFAALFPLDHTPDTAFNYSSGTSNIISAIVKRAVDNQEDYAAFLRRELFDRIGMTSAAPRFDQSGTWIASSFCFCTPRDFAKFGLLYLRDGMWDGERILPEGWVDYGRTPAPVQPADDESGYGAHWWLLGDDLGTFFASGYLGQYIFLVPALDLIIVRNGHTPAERRPHVLDLVRQIIELFRA